MKMFSLLFLFSLFSLQGESKTWDLPLFKKEPPLHLVEIQPGKFTMGSPLYEKGRDSDEAEFQVSITKPYWISTVETTAEQWEMIMQKRPEYFKWMDLKNAPVNQVTWTEVMDFCKKITILAQEKGLLTQNQKITLPTEAQWEYACRAGTTSPFPFYLDEIKKFSVCADTSISTRTVKIRKPNPWGLYDMQGNVAEWCLDWYAPYPTTSQNDYHGPENGKKKVARGGSWANFAIDLRSAKRFPQNPEGRPSYVGFRVVIVDVP